MAEAKQQKADGGGNLLTCVVRLSFPKIFKPESFEGGPEKFQATFIFDQEAQKSPEYAKLKAAVKAAAVKKWGDKLPKGIKSPFRPCSEKPHLAGYEDGHVFMKASSDTPPQLLDQLKNKITLADDGLRKLYPGCFVRAIVGAFAYDKKGNKGVSFGLRAIQKVKEGEALGAGGPVDHLLDELPVDDSAIDHGDAQEGGDEFGDEETEGGELD